MASALCRPWRRPRTRFAPLVALGLALATPATPTAAQQAAPDPEPQRRLRLDAPAPPPPPVDLTPALPGWTSGLRTLTTCPTCPADDSRAPVTNGNAPWRVGAFYMFGEAFNHVTFGVVGQRNERLPLFMTEAIGAPIGPPPPPSTSTFLSDPRIQWTASIAAEKTLNEWRGGQTLGVLGEAFLSLGAVGATPKARDAQAPSQRAVRGAFRVRF
jgi:hypothetical protein